MIILFGRSLFINKIRKYIPELQKKYTNAGINTFPFTFPNVDYWFFLDREKFIPKLPDILKDQHIVTYHKNECHLKHYGLTNYSAPIGRIEDRPSEDSRIIHYKSFTHSFALNWLYLQGFKKVILAGIDLDYSDKHFDDTKLFKPPSINVDRARFEIEKHYQDKMEILQLNPNSDFKIPKISIEDLL